MSQCARRKERLADFYECSFLIFWVWRNGYTYGSVVDEIDTNHVANIILPLLKNKEIQIRINNLVLEANKKRYEAYVLEQKAIKMVNEKVIYAK